ncbi:SOS response-associated peptidase [Candidatus Uhrbacteria bacterium]|nr:SOS response-associated peptidase [Candidatus Uhrbacteria bacterium]
MCGRFTLSEDKQSLEQRFGIKMLGRWDPRFNIAPSQSLPVIWNPGKPEFTRQVWGMKPVWWTHGARELINIRAETLKTKKTFKHLLAHQRCLVPADGFYEWEAGGRIKQPYYFSLKDKDIFAFPALWEKEAGDDGKEITTFSLITVPPNPLVKKIHDRMPCILKREDEERWLDPGLDSEKALDLCYAYPAKSMQAYPVSRAVNSPSQEGPNLIRRDGPILK